MSATEAKQYGAIGSHSKVADFLLAASADDQIRYLLHTLDPTGRAAVAVFFNAFHVILGSPTRCRYLSRMYAFPID